MQHICNKLARRWHYPTHSKKAKALVKHLVEELVSDIRLACVPELPLFKRFRCNSFTIAAVEELTSVPFHQNQGANAMATVTTAHP